MTTNLLKKAVREPLLHFLILGIAIFVAYSLVSKGSVVEGGKIVITQGQLASTWESFTQTRQREPNAEEWKGLIRERVREEVYYREALALGMDKDDLIIKRRLQQKMEFVSDDVAAQIQPTDDELTAYLQAHPDSFRVEQRFTFRQVFLNPEKHGQFLQRDATRLLANLSQTGSKTDISALGDPIMLDHKFDAVPASEIAKQFGGNFAVALAGLPIGQWRGPVESGYGVHLVFVNERVPGSMPELSAVRDAVRREWENARRLEANDQFYNMLLKHYTVTIESPEPPKKTLASSK